VVKRGAPVRLTVSGWSGAPIEVWQYEGGYGGYTDPTTPDEDSAKLVAYLMTDYGAQMLRYTLRSHAAVGRCGYYAWYSDVRANSEFAIRASVATDNPASQSFAIMNGEI